MMSMTGMSSGPTSASGPAFAQTALGLQSRIGDNWQLGFRGNLHRVEDQTDNDSFGTPVAQASAAQIELRSSPTDSYKLASTRSWWRYRDDVPTIRIRPTSVRTISNGSTAARACRSVTSRSRTFS